MSEEDQVQAPSAPAVEQTDAPVDSGKGKGKAPAAEAPSHAVEEDDEEESEEEEQEDAVGESTPPLTPISFIIEGAN